MNLSIASVSIRVATAAVLLGLSFTAGAASQCKGIEQNACSASSECTWVDSYERKDGRTVAAHCKSKPSRKSVSKAPAEAAKES